MTRRYRRRLDRLARLLVRERTWLDSDLPTWEWPHRCS